MAVLQQVKATKEAINRTAADEAIEFVTKGAKLTKVRSKFSKNVRYFSVEPQELVLTYKGSRKKKSCSHDDRSNPIYLSDVQEIRPGSQSDAFTIAYGKGHLPQDAQCFSLVIGEKGAMLDLVARDPKERDLWVRGIEEFRQRSKSKATNPTEVQQLYPIRLIDN